MKTILKLEGEKQITIIQIAVLLVSIVVFIYSSLPFYQNYLWLKDYPTPRWLPSNENDNEKREVTKSEKYLNLFGRPIIEEDITPEPEPFIEPIVDEPALPKMTVLGIIKNSNEEKSVVILEVDGQVDIYGINDLISEKIYISKIVKNSITIQSADYSETILLDKDVSNGVLDDSLIVNEVPLNSLTLGEVKKDSLQDTTQTVDSKKPNTIGEAWRLIKQNPQILSRYILFTGVDINGEQQGFRLNSGSDPLLFVESNLEEGDLLQKVEGNGFLLDMRDENQAAQLWEKLKNSDDIRFWVLRDGQNFYISLQD